MSRKIYGRTVGTPMKPQVVLDKTEHANDSNIHVTAVEKQAWDDGISRLNEEVVNIKRDIGDVEILLEGI